MEGFITQASNFVWSPALVALCLLGGLWFSVRGRFLQLRLIGEMVRLLFQKKVGEVGISSFQALTMTLAGRVGTGNIAGVATAICFGGPGALFWMWVVAFLGASSAFVESTLGQVFKVNIDGEYRGGPAYYIEKGLHSKPFAVLFAVVTVLAAGFLCPGVQGNSITSSGHNGFCDLASLLHYFRRHYPYRAVHGRGGSVHGSDLYRCGSHYRRREYR